MNQKLSLITKKQYIITGLLLLCMGFIIVKFFNDGFIRPVVGDYLVVLFQYCILRVLTNLSVRTSAFIVLIFSYLIEILQHFNILNVLGIKQTTTTDLIVGSTFDWFDMLAYTIAFFTIIFTEKYLVTRLKKSI